MDTTFFRKYFRRSIYLFLGIILIIMGCRLHRSVLCEQQASQHIISEIPTITVFVHGTRLFPKFGLQEQFYSAHGMVKVSDLDPSYKAMHMIAADLSRLDPKRFCYDRFYAFGWEGELNFDARLATSKELYEALNTLVDDYEKKNGVRPHLRVIAHSHGCNVVLNLAAVKSQDNRLTMDIVLLACPVQEETKHFIDDPIFNKRYALCSKGDFIQVIDPQGIQRSQSSHLFSERWFPQYAGVIQAKVKIKGRAIMHIEFLLERFIKCLPEILDVMDMWFQNAKSTDGIQPLPFPLIDLRANTVRIGPRNRAHAA